LAEQVCRQVDRTGQGEKEYLFHLHGKYRNVFDDLDRPSIIYRNNTYNRVLTATSVLSEKLCEMSDCELV